MQLCVAVDLVVRRRIGRHAKAFTGPRAQVDVFTALAAKWPKTVFGCVQAGPAAGRADHCFEFGQIRLHDQYLYGMAVGQPWGGRGASGAKGQLERCIFSTGMQTIITFVAHHTDRYHQAVTADFGNQAQSRVDQETQQLESAALGQGLLVLPSRCHHFLGHAGICLLYTSDAADE